MKGLHQIKIKNVCDYYYDEYGILTRPIKNNMSDITGKKRRVILGSYFTFLIKLIIQKLLSIDL